MLPNERRQASKSSTNTQLKTAQSSFHTSKVTYLNNRIHGNNSMQNCVDYTSLHIVQ